MPKFVCDNENCERKDEKETFASVSFRLVDGELIPTTYPQCKICGKPMKYVKPEAGPVGLNFNRFGSLSDSDKKKWIKKRNEKVKKEDEEKKRYYQKKQLGFNLD